MMDRKKIGSAGMRLPSVDRILRSDTAYRLIVTYGRTDVTEAVRRSLHVLREEMLAGEGIASGEAQVLGAAADILERGSMPSLRRVINLTGTVIHTNLGRAMLPDEAIAAVADVARGASNLEYDLDGGGRGDRDRHLEDALLRLTGAEAATVVNNNAAAVMLVLNTLALGGEVPVSRGELVEIGGSFRIPEIMNRSGCTLIEVGTTNRTHIKDFRNALGPKTALVMKVHASNYVITGFTAEVPEKEIAALCHANDRPFVIDLGAGSLIDLTRYGLPHEATPMDALRAGADLVTFSADKLLGGPQAGVIVGRKDLVDRLKANPMKRALRCDKMTIAALGAVLKLYSDPDRLRERLPTLRILTRDAEEIEVMARSLLTSFSSRFEEIADVSVVACESVIGSGALPTRTLPSAAIALRPLNSGTGGGSVLARIRASFAALPTPVIGRIHDGAFLLDLRCLEDARELADLVMTLRIAA